MMRFEREKKTIASYVKAAEERHNIRAHGNGQSVGEWYENDLTRKEVL